MSPTLPRPTLRAGPTPISPLVPPTLQPFGGRYIVRAAKPATVAGEPPSRIAIIAFDNVEKAQAWRDSAAYKALQPTRSKFLGNGESRAYIVDGASNQTIKFHGMRK